LQVDIKEAEKIKREKGVIIFNEDVNYNDEIDVKFLSEIIAARYEDIFEKIKQVLQDI
jgi:cell division ATPase FtsA